jgi:hypothetical protein
MSLPMPKPGQRVCVTLPYAGLRAMQVCAVADATDAEILEVCNRENPQQVSGGWHSVIRDAKHARDEGVDECAAPGPCVECPGRLHKIAICM